MALPRKRLLRKEIRQPDRFQVAMGRCLKLITAYRTQLITIGVALVVAGATAGGWYYYRAYQQSLALQDYNRGLREYSEGRYDSALNTFKRLQSRGVVEYTALTDIYIANSYMGLREPAKAVETLSGRILNDHDGFLTQVTLVGLGLAQEINGSCPDALDTMARALKLQGPLREEAMLAKARCHTELGNTPVAIDTYREYLKEFPDGRTVEIELLLMRLGAKAPKPSSP